MKNAKRHYTAPTTRTKAQPRSSRGGTLLGLFVGLVIGMLIALGVTWYLRQAPLPFENKHQPAPATPASPAPGGAAKPIALPGKPGGDAAKPRFDFYGILEGKQSAGAPGETAPAPVPNPTNSAPPAPTAATGATAPTTPPVKDSLFLQVGAFQKSADADNARAKLTLLGFETEVIEADIPDKGRMFRVRTGPYATAEEMNKARTSLAQNGIQAALVKAK